MLITILFADHLMSVDKNLSILFNNEKFKLRIKCLQNVAII